MCNFRLCLEDRTQQVGIAAVELDDFLELVEDHHDAALPLFGDPAEQLEQRLDRVVDVGSPARRPEAEAERAILRVDLHRRHDAQPAKELRCAFVGSTRRGVEVTVDRARKRRRESLLARDLEQIDIPHQGAFACGAARRAQYQRRLAVAPGRVDEHVLAVLQLGGKLAQLGLAVGEGRAECECAEAERVGLALSQASIILATIRMGGYPSP